MTGSDTTVKGRVTDGPWGPMLGALAARAFTGEVSIDAAGKRYAIEMRRGAVVGATSPMASDAVVRVALTSHLITPVHLPTITKAIAGAIATKRDEVEIVAEVAKLTADQTRTLRIRAMTQRAARTFAVETGDVTVQSAAEGGRGALDGGDTRGVIEIDIAAVIYLGAHMNLSEARLGVELARLGGKFALAAGADAQLPRFGFGVDSVAVANLLRVPNGTSLAELEATHREIDPRIASATIYALVSCGAAIATTPGRAEPLPIVARTLSEPVFDSVPTLQASARAPLPPRTRSDVVVPRTMTPPQAAALRATVDVMVPRTLTPSTPAGPPPTSELAVALAAVNEAAAAPSRGAPSTVQPPIGMTLRTPTRPPETQPIAGNPLFPGVPTRPTEPPPSRESGPLFPGTPTTPPPMRSASASGSMPAMPRTLTPRPVTESIVEIEQIVAARLAMVDQGADYYSLLGLVIDAPVDAILGAHGKLERILTSSTLEQRGSPEVLAKAKRLLEHLANANAVLSDPARRGAYVAALRRGGDPLIAAPRTRTEDERSPVDEAVHRALLAMRANQPERAAVELARAVELDPTNHDHAVMLAWARFCAATDKGKVAHETRRMLVAASRQSDKPQMATFYLGRVERMLGRDKEALALFHQTLQHDPSNLEAAAEVRVLEARLSRTRSR